MLRFRLDRDRITSENDVPEEVFLYKLCGTPCLPRGDLTMVTGPPKSGKTFFISMLMACAAGHRVLGLERIRKEPLRVLWYDTEQGRPSVCALSEVSWSGTAAWGRHVASLVSYPLYTCPPPVKGGEGYSMRGALQEAA